MERKVNTKKKEFFVVLLLPHGFVILQYLSYAKYVYLKFVLFIDALKIVCFFYIYCFTFAQGIFMAVWKVMKLKDSIHFYYNTTMHSLWLSFFNLFSSFLLFFRVFWLFIIILFYFSFRVPQNEEKQREKESQSKVKWRTGKK